MRSGHAFYDGISWKQPIWFSNNAGIAFKIHNFSGSKRNSKDAYINEISIKPDAKLFDALNGNYDELRNAIKNSSFHSGIKEGLLNKLSYDPRITSSFNIIGDKDILETLYNMGYDGITNVSETQSHKSTGSWNNDAIIVKTQKIINPDDYKKVFL